jgi:hypothetical protein
MAKARKKSRKKARKPAAKRSAKKRKSAAKTMAKSRARTKSRKSVKPKAKRVTAPKEGPIASAVHVVTDTIHEAAELRRRMEGRETFED